MKLAQLKMLAELVRQGSNVSRTAQALFIAQSAISRQIHLLEEELGNPLFLRRGKRLIEPTSLCTQVLDQINQIERAEANIRNLAANAANADTGVLHIGTTHTQARFFLPPIVAEFRRRFPRVELVIEQGVPNKLVDMLRDNLVDLAICTEAIGKPSDLTSMPCYGWSHALVCRADHSLAKTNGSLTLEQLAKQDLVTYSHQFAGGSHIRDTFSRAGLRPHIVLAAADSDVIKTYVRLGLGVGIIAAMSLDADKDGDLVSLPLGHLFGENVTRVAWRTSAVFPAFADACRQLMLRQGAKLAAANNPTALPEERRKN